MYYDVQGDGPDLLFMHGLTADRHQAQQTMSYLTDYRLVTLDMPGHGESLLSTEHTLRSQASFASYAGVAKSLIAHLGIERVIVGGISMGAGLALHLALFAPSLVKAMLLIRPAWLNRPGRPQLNIIEDIGNWIVESGATRAKNKLLESPIYRTLAKENPVCAKSIMDVICRPQSEDSAEVLTLIVADRPFSDMRHLRECTIPALVVGNNADPLHPPIIARKINKALKVAEYFIAPPKYLEPEAHKSAIAERIEQFVNAHFKTVAA